VSVAELQSTCGDNDRLAALVTNLLRAPLLVLLSDVEGLYDGDPNDASARVISTVTDLDESIMSLVHDCSTGPGKGGMASKLEAARIVTAAGENAIIASGRRADTLARIFAGEEVGTLLLAQGKSIAPRKRWIAFTAQPRGHLVLDEGARRAIVEQGRSLLSIGVIQVVGEFAKGDVIALRDPNNQEFARGLSNYPAAELRRIQGLKTDQIAAALGHCPYDEVVHRNNLALTT
ncbi:MAG: glutamate 5-kinase, partial [Planctomycetes bacterium]|nr:glutamate 5-kinase [Planctomycetota bacterium]